MSYFSSQVLAKIYNAKSVVVLTGAGISIDRGIPGFRDTNKKDDDILSKYTPEKILNIGTFNDEPDLVWKYYRERRKIINDSKINSSQNNSHIALNNIGKLLTSKGVEFYIITQNSDGLHNIVEGANTDNIYQIHGDIMKNRCLKCRYKTDNIEMDNDVLPKCPNCNSILKSDMSSFGEELPREQIEKSIEVSKNADVFIVIGTKLSVNPAARLPLYARKNDAFLIEINSDKSENESIMDLVETGKSTEILDKLLEELSEYYTNN